MDLLMKLLIKLIWRGVFQMYLFDFKQKSIALTNYPPLSAILQKNPLKKAGSFCFRGLFQNINRFGIADFLNNRESRVFFFVRVIDVRASVF